LFQDQYLYVYHMVSRKDNGYAATLNQYRCYNISLRSNTSRTGCFITIVAHNRAYFYIDREAPLVILHRRNEIALNTRCSSLSCYSNFRYSARTSDVLLADIGNFLTDVFTVSHAGNKESLLILMAHEWDAVCLRWTRRHSSFRNGYRIFMTSSLKLHCFISFEKVVWTYNALCNDATGKSWADIFLIACMARSDGFFYI